MIGVRIRFNDKSVSDCAFQLRNVGNALNDLTPVWNECLRVIEDTIALNYAEQGSFKGAWTPLTPQYLARKLAAGYPAEILIRTGAMYAASTHSGAPGNITTIEPKRMSFQVDMTQAGASYNYAYTHDVTGVQRRDGTRVVREFMILRKEAIETILRTLVAHINSARAT